MAAVVLALENEEALKIKRVARFMAMELANKGVKTVTVKPFTNIAGKETPGSKAVTDEFMKLLSSSDRKVLVKSSGAADAVITGTLTPFREDAKRQLSVKAKWSGTEKIITSYTAIFR